MPPDPIEQGKVLRIAPARNPAAAKIRISALTGPPATAAMFVYVGSALTSTRPLESGYAQKASLLQTLTCGYEGAHPLRSVTSGRHGNSRRRRQIPRKIPKISAPPGRLRDFCLLVSPARTVGSLPPGPFSAPPSPGGAAPMVRGHELPRGRPCSLGQHPHTLEARRATATCAGCWCTAPGR